MGEALGRVLLWGFFVPLGAMIALAQVLDKPWLLWGVPLGILGAIVLFIVIGMLWGLPRDIKRARKQRARIDRNIERYLRGRYVDLPPKVGKPPER